ncbi:MAG: pyridoxal-phosphate dependent enzyme, partial [Deltaproteobacteria bacterium]|nr:pyridoxal-phosphate dependent enzyme [Deltaproteobacteria bacterium]
AEIIRTPTEAAWDAPDSHIGVAKRLNELIPNSHILDQYSNPANPDAHEFGTGREIIDECDGKIDAVVLGAGTGGTVTGVARVIRRELPNCQIVGVDPEGSILAGPGPIHTYKVEGIGYDFVPDVLDGTLVDRWFRSNDRDSFRVARQLIRQEGLLCGGSSGAAVWAAMEVAKEMKPGQRVVTLLPDAVRNYMTKFIDDAWMRRNGFLEADWEMGAIGDIVRAMTQREVICIDIEATLGDAVKLFDDKGISQLPCTDKGQLAGIITEQDVLKVLVGGRLSTESSIAEVMERNVATVAPHTSAGELTAIFERGEVALVVDEERAVKALLTKVDLIRYLANRPAAD